MSELSRRLHALADPLSEFCFLDRSRRDLLDLVRQLASDTEIWLVIEAPTGFGKSKLLGELAKSNQDQKIPTLFWCATIMDDEQWRDLMSRGVEGLGEDFSSAFEAGGAGASLGVAGRKPWLILDDADGAPWSFLQMVLDFQAREGELSVVLAGQPGTAARIGDQFADHEFCPDIERLTVQPFDSSATQEYVESLFFESGFDADAHLEAADFVRLYQQSSGVPALINQFLWEELDRARSGLILRPLHGWMAAALVLVVAGVVLLNRQNRVDTPEMVQLELPKSEVRDEPAVAGNDNLALFEGLSSEGAPASSLSGASPNPVEADQAAGGEVRLLGFELPVEFVETLAAVSPDPAEKSGGQQRTRNASPSDPEGVPLRQEDWILQQPDGLFTLQLLLHSQESVVRDFIVTNSIEQQAAYYRKPVGNQVYFCLIYGFYESREASAKALDGLSHALRKYGPWKRTLVSVKQEIRRHAAPPS